MKHGRTLVAAIAIVVSGVAVADEDSVTRFRLTADFNNVTGCRALDAALGRLHTIIVKNGDVEIMSAGGIGGRMKEIRPGIYGLVFEL